jgi:hypothetical protein
MALDRNRINMAFGLFVIPLLIFGFPYFPLPAQATGERPIQVKLGTLSIRIDVGELLWSAASAEG